MKQSILKERNLKILFVVFFALLVILVISKFITNGNGIKLKKVTLNATKLDLTVGDTFKLEPKESGKYKYECEDNSVATINSDGEIKALKVGTTTVYVSTNDGYKVKCELKVYTKINEIKSKKLDIYIGKKDKEKLKYSIKPKDGKVLSENWKIDDDSIASLDGDTVKGKEYGSTKVYLTINDEYKLTYNINIVKKIDKLITDDKLTIDVGEEEKIDVDYKPSSADEVPYNWEVEDEDIASIDDQGNVTGLKDGKTNIIVSTPYGVEKKIKLTVKEIPVRSVSLNKSNITLTKSETTKIKATVRPDNATDSKVKWSSSDSKIADVDSEGNVMPKKVGKVTITASAGGKKAKCTIDVKNNTHDKSAIFFGDSITYGYKSTPKGYGWGEYIGDHYDIGKIKNAGKSGWLLSNALGTTWLNTVLLDYKNKKYDYVILHGGTNDIKRGVPLGVFNQNDYSGNYKEDTFLGGLETYLYTAKSQWPNAKMGFIITYETPNSTENRRKLSAKYYTEMKKVLDKWNVKYLDLYFGKTSDGKKYSDLLKVKTYEYVVDGIHLNRAGYRVLSPHIYEWMNTL